MANVFTNASRTTLATDTNAVIYTSPAATETVVHSIYVDNPTVTAATLTLSLNGSLPFASNISISNGAPVIFDKPVNLNAGDTLTATTTTAGIHILASVLQIS